MRISDWSSDVCSSDLLGAATVEADFSTELADGDCHDFRVWAGIMGKKESHYVTTQRAGDPGRSSGSTAGRQRRSCSAGSRRIARYAEESDGRTGAQCRDGSSSGRSEERRVGKEGVSKCEIGWAP